VSIKRKTLGGVPKGVKKKCFRLRQIAKMIIDTVVWGVTPDVVHFRV
jgi:hypothetical protein